MNLARTGRPSIPALTALRGLAAWWVVLYHFKEEFPTVFHHTAVFRFVTHGDLAVDLFFELSGFVIALNYAADFEVLRWASYGKFLILRLARIYPLYIFVLLMFLVNPIAIALWSSAGETSERYRIGYFFLSLALIQNWGFTDMLRWNIPAWSISTEWAAYLVFPLIVWPMTRFGRTAPRSGLVVASLLALLAACCYLLKNTLGSDIVHFGLLRCILEFGIGVAIFQLWEHWPRNAYDGRVAAMAAVAVAAIFFAGFVPDYIAIPLVFGLILFTLAIDKTISTIVASPILVHLGEISYSTYLIHYFIKDWVKYIFVHPWMPAVIPVIIYLGSIIVASLFLHRFIEVPARQFIRTTLTYRRSAIVPASSHNS